MINRLKVVSLIFRFSDMTAKRIQFQLPAWDPRQYEC